MGDATHDAVAPVRRLALGVGLAAILVGAAGYGGWQLSVGASATPPALTKALAKHFPKTPIDEVRCDLPLRDLCEVVTGRNLFYAARDGRYVVVGSLLDLKEKVDLTDQRLRQLSAVASATSRIANTPAQASPTAPAEDPGVVRVTLGREGAVVHNPGAPLKLTVFSDLNCGYCRQLFGELREARDIEVVEYPIAILGADSAEKAKMALCAKDRAATVNALYFGGEVEVRADCAEGGKHLAANMAFAQANGIVGTPALVRGDGALHRGFMPVAELRAWLKADQS